MAIGLFCIAFFAGIPDELFTDLFYITSEYFSFIMVIPTFTIQINWALFQNIKIGFNWDELLLPGNYIALILSPQVFQ